MTLYCSYPAMTIAMAWMLLGESGTCLAVLGCTVSMAGVACVAKPPFLFGGSVHYDLDHWLGTQIVCGTQCICVFRCRHASLQ